MKKAIRRYKLGYGLGIALSAIGLTALSVLIWKAWPEASSSRDPLSAFWNYLFTGQLSFVPSVEFRPLYLVILAVITLSCALAVFLFSRQKFLLPGRTMQLECPFCKKHWHASYDRGQVLCPHCHHLIHPKMTPQ
ncbi:MAG TPA: hypothetical protein VMW14_02125 [Candidatus Paceibacterota bacterium]|nr:hypothetical protein [Candidatus Paceibacterota bacterium]